MTTEWGALAGVFPVDDKTLNWYDLQAKRLELGAFNSFAPSPGKLSNSVHPRINENRINQLRNNILKPDNDANYSAHLTLDLNTLVPHVSGPNSVKVSTPLPQLSERNIKIDKAYLVSCTNSRVSDISAAASIVKGKKIAPHVEFYIAAASSIVQKDSETLGDWQTLVDAGAKTLPAGCGPCIGLGTGLLEDGQVGISATNRNYKGRMGSPNALAYLASPAVVASSAVNGYISGPSEVEYLQLSNDNLPTISIKSNKDVDQKSGDDNVVVEDLLPSFPATFSGPLLFAPQDNLTTDGMYPGKYTYQDDITPEKQADVVMENYDPSFAKIVKMLKSKELKEDDEANKNGVILASGFNFGTGSSREQAATAILNSGIPLVLGGSFGDVYRRNAINNGLIVIECPELINDLTNEFTQSNERGKGGLNGEQTVHTGRNVKISTSDGKIIIFDDKGDIVKTYIAARVGTAVQDIWIAGGLEGWVKRSISSS